MPRVPVLTEQRVSTSALPTPAARPIGPSGAAAFGRGLQQAGDVALQIATREQDDANRFRVAQLDLEAGRLLNDASYGPSGFMLAEGENAFAYEERLGQLKTSLESLTSRAANPAQQEMFRLKMASRLEDTRGVWARHSDTQRDRLFGEIAEGQAGLAVEVARKQYDDPAAVESAFQKLVVEPDGSEGVLIRHLRNRGLPVEQVNAAVGSLRAKVYGEALRGYLQAGDLAGARRWYEAKLDQLGKDGAKFGAAIAKAETAQWAGNAAARIIGAARDPETGAVNELQVRTALSSLNEADAEKRKAVLDAAAPMLANEKAATEARRKDVRNLARGLYNRGGLNAVRSQTLPDGTNLLDYLNRNDAEYEATLRRDSERKAKEGRESRTERNERDRQALAEFRALDPEERASVDADDFGMKWGASSVGTSLIRAEQQKANQAVERGLVAGERDFVRDAEVQTAGLPSFTALQGGNAAKKVQAKKTALRSGAALAYSQFVEKNKREPDNEERQKMIDGLLRKQVTEEHWYGDDEAFGFEIILDQTRAGGGATPASTPQKSRPTEQQRMDQLLADGKSDDEIDSILAGEGY